MTVGLHDSTASYIVRSHRTVEAGSRSDVCIDGR